MLQPSVTPQHGDEHAASRVNIVVLNLFQVGGRPHLKLVRQRAMARFEKWPRVKALVRHSSISRETW
jgi:hypothetical protein